MRKHGRTKSHFIETKLIVEINKLRLAGNSYNQIAKVLSMRHKRHFSVGLVHTIYSKTNKNSAG